MDANIHIDADTHHPKCLLVLHSDWKHIYNNDFGWDYVEYIYQVFHTYQLPSKTKPQSNICSLKVISLSLGMANIIFTGILEVLIIP